MLNGLLNTIKNIKHKEKDPLIGQVYIEEILPIFHDHAMTTNKTLWYVNSVVSKDVVTVRDLELSRQFRASSLQTKQIDLSAKRVLTQNGVPIKVNKKGKFIQPDLGFSKENYACGDFYAFSNLGYLGDVEGVSSVSLVTDQYVFFEDFNRKKPSIYSFKELKRINPVKK